MYLQDYSSWVPLNESLFAFEGIVVGSLEILGNPTGLVRSIGTGVADLVKKPYAGLTQGPGAFVTGVSSGMSSFVRNISAGRTVSTA